MYIGACRLHMMHQTTGFVHTDMHLVAEVSCVALLGLTGIRVALLLTVFG